MLLLHQTKQHPNNKPCVVQVIVIVTSYGCLMDAFCKCIVRLNDFSLFLFHSSVDGIFFSRLFSHSIGR